VALLAGVSPPAEAEEPELEWRAPAGCPSQAEVDGRVTAAAGGAELAPARVEVVAQRTGRTWRVEVHIGDEIRVLTGETCDEVASAAALVVALALRQDEVAPSVEEPARDRADVVAAEAPSESVRVEGRAVHRGSPLRMLAFATAGGEVGLMPSAAVAVSAGAEIARRHLALRLAATYATAEVTGDADAMYASARVTRVGAAGRACATVRPLSVCGGAEVGRMAATVVGPDDRDDGSGLWVAAAAGPGLGVRFGPSVELAVQTELVVPLVYPRFSVNGSDGPPGPAVAGGRLAAALRVQFR
jgi:hypothetical protein